MTQEPIDAYGPAAQGVESTLHYADNIETPRNSTFRKSFALAYKANGNVHVVQD